MIIDTHCHLNDQELFKTIDEEIKNAKAKGVGRFFVVGWDCKSSGEAIQIARKYEDCCSAIVGIHPSEANKTTMLEILILRELINQNLDVVIGVGEIGLDYHYEDYNKDNQKALLVNQLQLANMFNLPIIIHNRDSIDDLISILQEYKLLINNGGILHCFCGPKERIPELLEMGLYLGFGGVLTFKNGQETKDSLLATPLDRVLFETDCPYLAPTPYRGKLNRPEYIVETFKEASNLLNKSIEELEKIEEENVSRLFGI